METKVKSKMTLIRREILEKDGAFYKYELQMKDRKCCNNSAPLYLISIEMTLEGGSTTYAETGEIFANVNKAIRFFDKMVTNLATPIDLPYILEDEIKS